MSLSTEALLTADYVNEGSLSFSLFPVTCTKSCIFSHIRAFAEALDSDADFLNDRDNGRPTDASPSSAPPSPVAPTLSRIRKVSALSDFAPVHLKVKRYAPLSIVSRKTIMLICRRKRKDKANTNHAKGPRHDWSFVLFRWPLLVGPTSLQPLKIRFKHHPGFHFPIYRSRVWSLRTSAATGQFKRVGLSL
jgi:hypothetical protein